MLCGRPVRITLTYEAFWLQLVKNTKRIENYSILYTPDFFCLAEISTVVLFLVPHLFLGEPVFLNFRSRAQNVGNIVRPPSGQSKHDHSRRQHFMNHERWPTHFNSRLYCHCTFGTQTQRHSSIFFFLN